MLPLWHWISRTVMCLLREIVRGDCDKLRLFEWAASLPTGKSGAVVDDVGDGDAVDG